MGTKGDDKKISTFTLADNLREIMGFRDVSPLELARVSGVPQPRISEIVNGKTKNPQMKTLKKLADALRVTVGELTSEEGVLAIGDRMQTSEAIHLKGDDADFEAGVDQAKPPFEFQEELDLIRRMNSRKRAELKAEMYRLLAEQTKDALKDDPQGPS